MSIRVGSGPASSNPEGYISEAQIRRAWAICFNERRIKQEAYAHMDFVLEQFGYDDIIKVKLKDYDAICEELGR